MQNERKVVELPIEDVLPNRFQPRIKFDESSINELAISIKRYGVIQPIVVRQIGTKYEIIAGERRYKASVLAGKKSIPAIICELSDKDSVEIALIENVQREDLTPIEKAISYKKILDMGYITQEELAEKVGKSQSAIANTLRLLNLSDEVQEALLENKISERHARSLLKIKDENKQINMLNKIISERLTVRKTDEEIDKMLNDENYVFTNENTSAPVEPVVTDEIVNIPDTELTNPVNLDLPGFMNIDKIEQVATDINVEPTKPEIDMDQLLTSAGMPASDVEVIPQDTTLHSNKFFNFFDEESDNTSAAVEVPTFEVPTMPEVETPAFEVPTVPEVEVPAFEVPTVPEVEVPTFEVPTVPEVEVPTFEVPTMPEVEVPAFEVPPVPEVEVPTFEVPTMPEVETPAFEVPTMPEMEIPTFEVPTVPEVEVPTFEVPTVPEVEVPAFEVPTMPEVEVPAFEVPTMPEVETPAFEVPIVPAVEVPTFEVPTMPEVEVPAFEVPTMPEVEVPAFEVPTVPEVEVPTFEVPTMPEVETPAFEVPTMPEMEIPTFEPDSIPAVDEVVENNYVNDTQNAEFTNDFVAVPNVSTPDIKLALNAIRECEAKLESLGFVVDAEEIDFEGNYQVIFNIQK